MLRYGFPIQLKYLEVSPFWSSLLECFWYTIDMKKNTWLTEAPHWLFYGFRGLDNQTGRCNRLKKLVKNDELWSIRVVEKQLRVQVEAWLVCAFVIPKSMYDIFRPYDPPGREYIRWFSRDFWEMLNDTVHAPRGWAVNDLRATIMPALRNSSLPSSDSAGV
jgi:hypothetical protein